MKVWYCNLHESFGNDVACDLWDVTGEWGNTIPPCQIVEMQLVPADALVIEKAVQLIAQDGSVAWEASIKEEES